MTLPVTSVLLFGPVMLLCGLKFGTFLFYLMREGIIYPSDWTPSDRHTAVHTDAKLSSLIIIRTWFPPWNCVNGAGVWRFVSHLLFSFLSIQWVFLYCTGICVQIVGIFLLIKQWCLKMYLIDCIVLCFTLSYKTKYKNGQKKLCVNQNWA